MFAPGPRAVRFTIVWLEGVIFSSMMTYQDVSRGPWKKNGAVPSIYSSASPWVGSRPCGAKYSGFCADSKGV